MREEEKKEEEEKRRKIINFKEGKKKVVLQNKAINLYRERTEEIDWEENEEGDSSEEKWEKVKLIVQDAIYYRRNQD